MGSITTPWPLRGWEQLLGANTSTRPSGVGMLLPAGFCELGGCLRAFM